MLLRTLRLQASRPMLVLALRTRGGTTVVRDLPIVRTRMRRLAAAQGQARFSDMAMLSPVNRPLPPVPVAERPEKEEEHPWHVLSPARLAILNTCGNLCGLAAAATHDYITMRGFSVLATATVAAFNFLMPKPLKAHQWTAGTWGAVFAVLHLVNLSILLHDRSHKKFTEEEEEIFESGFQRYGVTPHQFSELLAAGCQFKDLLPGEMLVEAESSVDKVCYVVRGSIEARHPETGALRIEYHDDVFVGCMEPKAWQREYGKAKVPLEEEDSSVVDDPLQLHHHHKSTRNIRAMLNAGLEEKTGPRTKLLAGTYWRNNNIAGPEGCRVLYWSLSSFASVVGKDEKLVRSMERLDEMGLVCKMTWGAHHMASEGYRELLESVSSDGWIKPEDKRGLARYRARFGVPETEHNRILGEIGWTQKEFEEGTKKSI